MSLRPSQLAGVLIGTVTLGLLPTLVLASHFDAAHVLVTRVAGSDRVDTAIRLSGHIPRQDPVPCVEAPTQRCVGAVVARADGYADALAGGQLASAHRSPILLTPGEGLPPAVAAAVEERGTERAWILGGTAALSPQVEADLRAAGVMTIERISGGDRFETASKIALSVRRRSFGLGRPARLFVTVGSHPDPHQGWADALSGSALAGSLPLLLVQPDNIPPATRDALAEIDPIRITIVGGVAAVSERVESELRGMGFEVDRIAGSNRYETSWLAARAAAGEGQADGARLWLATGEGWPDALAAAAAITMSRGVLLLARPETLRASPHVESWLDAYREDFEFIRMIGGLAALSLALEDELRRSTEPCHPSYPEVCIGPPPPQLTCNDIGYRDFAVTGEDPHDFDPQRTGRACPNP